MLAGVSRGFREADATTRIVALQPASSPVLTDGKRGPHHIEGVAVLFAPPLLAQADYDEVRSIAEEDARAMARRLAGAEGILAGTSTGMNVAGAIAVARDLGPGRTVLTVAVDTGLKYLAGDLFAAG